MQNVGCLFGNARAVFTAQVWADVVVLKVCRDRISTNMPISSESLK